MGKFDNVNALIAPEQPQEKPWVKGQVVSVETGSSSDEPTTTNNVGNLRPVGSDTGFQQFKTPQEGIAAMDKNLEVYGSKHGINTLRGVISRWAPTLLSPKVGCRPYWRLLMIVRSSWLHRRCCRWKVGLTRLGK